MPVCRVAGLAKGLAIAGARRLADEHHANAKHGNIDWKAH